MRTRIIKNNHLLRIGIDIDNTLANSSMAVVSRFNERFGTELVYDDAFDFYHFEETLSLPREKIDRFFNDMESDKLFLTTLPVFDDSKKVVADWSREGHSIHFVTARPPVARESTLAWLKEHGFWTSRTTLDLYEEERDADAPAYKLRIVNEKKIDILIEDSGDIAEVMTIPVLLLDHPWNRKFKKPHIHRVKNWSEVEKWVNSHKNRIRRIDGIQ